MTNYLLTFLIILYLLVLPFGQLFRIPTPWPDVTLHLTDLIIGTLFLCWMAVYLCQIFLDKKVALRHTTSIHRPLAVFSLILLFSWLITILQSPFRETIASGFYLVRWVAYASLFPILLTLSHEIRFRRLAHDTFLVSIFLLVIGGWLQYWFFPDLRSLETIGWDPHYYRLTGTLLDPGFMGILLVMAFFWVMGTTSSPLALRSLGEVGRRRGPMVGISETLGLKHEAEEKIPTIDSRRSSPRTSIRGGNDKNWLHSLPGLWSQHSSILKPLLLSAIYITLAFTYSRASYLAWLAGMLVLSLRQKSWKLLSITAILAILTWLCLPRPSGEGGNLARTSTVNYRLINYQQAIQVIQDHPLFGVGFNRYRYAQRDYGFLTTGDWESSHAGAGADNSWLFILATTGVVGFTSFLWLCWNIFKLPLTPSFLKRGNGLLLEGEGWVRSSDPLLPILIALLVHSQFHNTLFYTAVIGWTWLLLSLYPKNHQSSNF